MEMEKVGFIGLGIMGRPMALNLLRAGYSVYGYDVREEAVSALSAQGAVGCASIAEAARACSLIITMLPNSPQVKDAVLGKDGVAQSAAPGTLLVDMSSIAPAAAQDIAKELAMRGIRMLDAPVSGGEPKAVDGTLAIMAGGAQEDFARARPIFSVLGASAVRIGEVGCGNVCKLANQTIVASNIAALAEGLMLAQKAGADPQIVFEAIRGGLAGSTVMDAKAPMMLSGSFEPGFRIDLHIKDLTNALDTGYRAGAPLPLSAMVMQMLQNLCADGGGGLDHSALAKYYEKLAGESLGR